MSTPNADYVLLDQSQFNRTGRCNQCRSLVSDLGPSGTCYPCEALAVGDLIACANCGWWIPRADARKPCEDCGQAPLAAQNDSSGAS